MKILYTFLLLFFCQSSFCQDSSFDFKLIDTASGSKEDLYTKARSWITNYFVSSKAVLEMEDKEAGRLIGKGIILYDIKYMMGMVFHSTIHFTITVDVKKDKYRLELSDYWHEGGYPSASGNGGKLINKKPACGTISMPMKYWEKIKLDALKESTVMQESFKTSMNQKIDF